VQVSILADHFFLQRSGELVTQVGFNVVNEIIHTLAFLAAAMVWSQVLITHLPRPYAMLSQLCFALFILSG